MTLPRFLIIAAASWAILACLGTAGWCAVVALYRREHVNRIVSLPPVPSPRPDAESDADWLPGWISSDDLVDLDEPAEITEAEIYNRLAYDIERNMRVLGDAA